jgi:hypothetical protein
MNTSQITVNREGKNLGPFTLEEINQKLQTGQLASTDLAWPQGSPNWIPLGTVPGISLQAPPPLPPGPPIIVRGPVEQGDGTGGLIPYKNPKALTAYYLAVFGLIPIIGFFLAIPAVILGILGLLARKKTPQIRGVAHAWVGIILGSLSIIGHVAVLLILATR